MAAPSVNSEQSTCPLILFGNNKMGREKKKAKFRTLCFFFIQCLKFEKGPHFCFDSKLFILSRIAFVEVASCFPISKLKTIKIRLWCHSQNGLPRYMEHSSSLLNDQSPLALIFGWTKLARNGESSKIYLAPPWPINTFNRHLLGIVNEWFS